MWWKRDGICQLEADYCFRSEGDVAIVARQCSARCSGACTCECTDCRTLTASRQAANQGTGASTTTDESSGALALAGSLLTINTGVDGIAYAANRYGLKRDTEAGCALEFSCRLGIRDSAAYRRSRRNRSHSAYGHRISQCSVESFSSIAGLGAERTSEGHR